MEEFDYRRNRDMAFSIPRSFPNQVYLSCFKAHLDVVRFSLMQDEGDSVSVQNGLGKLSDTGVGVRARRRNHLGGHGALKRRFLSLSMDSDKHIHVCF